MLPGSSLDGGHDAVTCCAQITCGGLQSSHTAAVAQLCAERGVRAHLLVRGERPAVPTGLHLYARMLGRVTYVGRAEYADREAMFEAHLRRVQADAPRGAKVSSLSQSDWRLTSGLSPTFDPRRL